jgi:hypothetical protein
MKLLRNAKTLLSNPEIAWNYSSYWVSKLTNSGQAIRVFPDGIKVTGLSGFSEFHSCSQYASREEREFLQNYPLGSGKPRTDHCNFSQTVSRTAGTCL